MKGKCVSRAADKSGDNAQVLGSHVYNSHATINRRSDFFFLETVLTGVRSPSFMLVSIPMKNGRNNTVSGVERT